MTTAAWAAGGAFGRDSSKSASGPSWLESAEDEIEDGKDDDDDDDLVGPFEDKGERDFESIYPIALWKDNNPTI